MLTDNTGASYVQRRPLLTVVCAATPLLYSPACSRMRTRD
jgi:hypothetical protein